MGNFDFVRETLPSLHADCVRAESYLSTDPRATGIYSRRIVEELVDYLYDLLRLPAPYPADLSGHINDPAFRTKTGGTITQKLNFIRHVGNDAAHTRPVTPQRALDSLRELHHVMVWAAFNHSPSPQAVPTRSQFDSELARRAAPVPRAEVASLVASFRARDDERARALAERDERLAAYETEMSELRQQVATAQAASFRHDDHDYREDETRDRFIDVLLAEAGWPLTEARDREYQVIMPGASTGSRPSTGSGRIDYVLWGADGLPLAVVEAKRTTRSPHEGQQQAKLYADALEAQFGRRPVIFTTNGYEHWLTDDAAGFPPREVQGFYTRDELDLMVQRRTTRLPLAGQPVNSATVERPYQVRAIKAVGAAFDAKQRDALLVMATGSGKTRTVIALVEQLMKSGWAKRVLFLADRTALVNQAAGAFRAHLPSATTVNLVTERATDGRVYVSTYPTMLNLVNDVDERGRRFGPGFFDLMVIDEAHRSVYAKYGAIFDYFDSLLVGLTATPKDEVDHNTYRLFHLEDGAPTDAYGLDEAVADGYLVPPWTVAVGTKFLRQGIRYADLTEEERDQWDSLEWGEDGPPDEVGAEELNRFLFNADTVDKVLGTLMRDGYRVAGGDRIGKTIIFAKSQQHAEFIAKRFWTGWPELGDSYAKVITHGDSYAQTSIDNFSTPEREPHIAISVDMLDTGIDVPEVVNLVFFKMVRSKTKFWQMIGRGTRLRPDLFGPGADKQDFLVFDFCGNLEFFSQDLPTTEGSTQKSLTQRIFEARLGLLRGLDAADAEARLRRETAAALRAAVAGMNLDNVLVRPHRRSVERFAAEGAWTGLTDDQAQAAYALAGLPTAVRDDDEQAKRFDLLVLRRQLAQLEGDLVAAERLRETIQATAGVLLGKTAIPSVAEQTVLLESVAGDEWWVDVTLPMLEVVRLRLRSLVRFVENTRRSPVYTDFADELTEVTSIDLPRVTPGTNMARFRAKATAYLRQHEDHVALQRLRRNRQLTTDDLTALEEMLVTAGGGPADLAWAAERPGGLGIFIRSLVGLDRHAATEAFAAYLDGTRFSVDQIRFVSMIVEELTANGVVEPRRLFESPYVDRAPTGPDYYFPDADIEVIVEILNDITAHAVPSGAA